MDKVQLPRQEEQRGSKRQPGSQACVVKVQYIRIRRPRIRGGESEELSCSQRKEGRTAPERTTGQGEQSFRTGTGAKVEELWKRPSHDALRGVVC